MPIKEIIVGLAPEGAAPPGEEQPGEETPGKGLFERMGEVLGVSERTALWMTVGGGVLLLLLLLRR